ncbi:hypothetical protein C8Q74DRAFT_97440 [Fomes fomentarius]|nr:hypothetical protein C8Q74DRAFT_97440 [Fomes fomentarius]
MSRLSHLGASVTVARRPSSFPAVVALLGPHERVTRLRRSPTGLIMAMVILIRRVLSRSTPLSEAGGDPDGWYSMAQNSNLNLVSVGAPILQILPRDARVHVQTIVGTPRVPRRQGDASVRTERPTKNQSPITPARNRKLASRVPIRGTIGTQASRGTAAARELARSRNPTARQEDCNLVLGVRAGIVRNQGTSLPACSVLGG